MGVSLIQTQKITFPYSFPKFFEKFGLHLPHRPKQFHFLHDRPLDVKDIAENVDNKSFDLGIIEGPVELPENMESIAFLEDELVLAIPADHPFA